MRNSSLLVITRGLLIIITVLISTRVSFSQNRDSLLNVYNNQTIHSFGNVFVKGSRQMKFKNLKSELTSPLTRSLFIESRKNLRRTKALSVTAIAALAGSVILRKNSTVAASGLSLAAIALNLGAIRFRKQSSEIIDRALWHKNKEILFNVSE